MSQNRVAAVRLTRKAVSIAIFNQTHLEYVHVRHLPTSGAKAYETLQSFLAWASAQFKLELIAMERLERSDQRRIEDMIGIVEAHATKAAVPVWRTSKLQVIGSYAEPAPGTRTELREIAARIWPVLGMRGNHPLNLEAAALGLYVQVERLLSTPFQ